MKRQLPDGGWNIYYGGPSEVNASVKAYFALKLAGHSADLPFMQEARANILRLGGIPRMNTFSKLYLALLGQFPWHYLPSIPVEMILLPNWAPFNLYRMSSWSRAMLVPLAIINHFKPTRDLGKDKQLHELYPVGTEGNDFTLPRDQRLLTWRNFFLRADRALKILERWHSRPLRQRALEEAERWMVERIGEGSDGLAAVFPAMLNSVIALRALDYPKEHPLYQKALKDFSGLVHAIRNDLGVVIDVVDYHEHAASAGADATAVCYVETTGPDGVLWGVGQDPSILNASYKAVFSAVNRQRAED